MLQSFLSKNNSSLTSLNLEPLMPSQYQFQKPSCCIFQKKQNNGQEPIPKSPNYKRKKIFGPQDSPQSQATGGFKEIDLTQSTVQTYRLPIAQQKLQEISIAKKKTKVSKQNSLFLANGKLDFKHSPRPIMESIPSSNRRLIENKYGKCEITTNNQSASKQHSPSIREGCQNEQSECSLKVLQGRFELFTFKSESNVSFEYSASKDSNGTKMGSF